VVVSQLVFLAEVLFLRGHPLQEKFLVDEGNQHHPFPVVLLSLNVHFKDLWVKLNDGRSALLIQKKKKSGGVSLAHAKEGHERLTSFISERKGFGTRGKD